MRVRFVPVPDHVPSLAAYCNSGFRLAQFLNRWAVVPLSLVRADLELGDISAAWWLTPEERHRLIADIELDEDNVRTVECWPNGSRKVISFETLAHAEAHHARRKAWLETPIDEAVRQAMSTG